MDPPVVLVSKVVKNVKFQLDHRILSVHCLQWLTSSMNLLHRFPRFNRELAHWPIKKEI